MAIDMDILNAAMVRHRTPEEAAAASAANAVHKTELGQDDFLTLMITQLKNQDPMKPLDPSQYVGQLAQFSSVAGLKEVNTSIANLTNSLRGNQVLDGAGMIGRTVIAQGNDVYLDAPSEDRQGIAGAIEVPSGTNSLQLVVKDASGATIKTQAMATTAGMRGFQWDGTTDSGAQAPAGAYRVEIVANVAGKNESLATSIAAGVSSVSLDPKTGGLMLDTDTLGEISMSDVERVL
jgi:flagellar basal-body rod modification protein FlgD